MTKTGILELLEDSQPLLWPGLGVGFAAALFQSQNIKQVMEKAINSRHEYVSTILNL